jgi:hypothetical protein
MADVPLQHVLGEEAMSLHSEHRNCLPSIQSVLVREEDSISKLQVVPLLPALQLGSLERVDMCGGREKESYVVAEMMLKANVEEILKSPKGVIRAWSKLHLWLFLPSCQVLAIAAARYLGCFSVGDIVVIMALVMHIIPDLLELCGEPLTYVPLILCRWCSYRWTRLGPR